MLFETLRIFFKRASARRPVALAHDLCQVLKLAVVKGSPAPQDAAGDEEKPAGDHESTEMRHIADYSSAPEQKPQSLKGTDSDVMKAAKPPRVLPRLVPPPRGLGLALRQPAGIKFRFLPL